MRPLSTYVCAPLYIYSPDSKDEAGLQEKLLKYANRGTPPLYISLQIKTLLPARPPCTLTEAVSEQGRRPRCAPSLPIQLARLERVCGKHSSLKDRLRHSLSGVACWTL